MNLQSSPIIRHDLEPAHLLHFVRQTSTCAFTLIALLEGIVYSGNEQNKWVVMASTEDQDVTAVAAIHILNGYCLIHGTSTRALQRLVLHIAQQQTLKKLAGEIDSIEAIALLPSIAKRIVRDETEHFMVLRAFQQQVEPDGNYRAALAQDIPVLRAYAAGYSAEHNVPFRRDWNRVVATRQAMLAESLSPDPPGRVAACLMHGAVAEPFILCSGVYTFPDYRGQGYATRLVSNFCFEASLAGLDTCLYVGIGNQPAIRAYTRVGFAPVHLYRTLSLGNTPETVP